MKVPGSLISGGDGRVRMYKRISSLGAPDARADLEAEIIDRYGPIPASVSNLLNYAMLKSAAESLLVQSIERKTDEVWMRFHEQAPVDPSKLTQFVRHHRDAMLRPNGSLRFKLGDHDGELVEQIQNALQELRAER